MNDVAAMAGGVAIGRRLVRWRRRGLRHAIGQRVVVHTTDDRTIEGVLVGAYVDTVGIRHARLLQAGDAPDVPLGGDVLVLLGAISLIQVGAT